MDSVVESYNMRRIHLEGARTQVHPEGEPGKSYDLVAPLNASGRIGSGKNTHKTFLLKINEISPIYSPR